MCTPGGDHRRRLSFSEGAASVGLWIGIHYTQICYSVCIYIYIYREREIYIHITYTYIYVCVCVSLSLSLYIYIYIYTHACLERSSSAGFLAGACFFLAFSASTASVGRLMNARSADAQLYAQSTPSNLRVCLGETL